MSRLRAARRELWSAGAAAVVPFLLVAAAVRSCRTAGAAFLSSRGTEASAAHAVGLAPGNAQYRARLAARQDRPGGSAAEAVRQWEAALRLNPRDASSWIALGLRREGDGDLASAERCLLQAARVDARYHPRWTLAGFYFRRGDAENFWVWAERAAARAHGDPAPLFRLCSEMGGDRGRTLQRVAAVTPPLLAGYLQYLLARGDLEAAYQASGELAARGCHDEAVSRLIPLCERLIASGAAPCAVNVWNAMARGKCIPHDELDPARGRSLSNPDFRLPPAGAFDWRLVTPQGISIARLPAGLRLTFSGEQPESGDVLLQVLPLAERRRYRFEIACRASAAGEKAGVAWRIEDARGGRLVAADQPLALGEAWQRRAFEFVCPPGAALVRLVLTYRRVPGTTRWAGAIWLRRARLDFAP